MKTNTPQQATAPTPRTIPNASRIIARASLSILRDTTPHYSRGDIQALKALKEYGY